jgi:hypothetical protein
MASVMAGALKGQQFSHINSGSMLTTLASKPLIFCPTEIKGGTVETVRRAKQNLNDHS